MGKLNDRISQGELEKKKDEVASEEPKIKDGYKDDGENIENIDQSKNGSSKKIPMCESARKIAPSGD